MEQGDLFVALPNGHTLLFRKDDWPYIFLVVPHFPHVLTSDPTVELFSGDSDDAPYLRLREQYLDHTAIPTEEGEGPG